MDRVPLEHGHHPAGPGDAEQVPQGRDGVGQAVQALGAPAEVEGPRRTANPRSGEVKAMIDACGDPPPPRANLEVTGLRSTATTRPDGPTRAASQGVYTPSPQAMSSADWHPRRAGANRPRPAVRPRRPGGRPRASARSRGRTHARTWDSGTRRDRLGSARPGADGWLDRDAAEIIAAKEPPRNPGGAIRRNETPEPRNRVRPTLPGYPWWGYLAPGSATTRSQCCRLQESEQHVGSGPVFRAYPSRVGHAAQPTTQIPQFWWVRLARPTLQWTYRDRLLPARAPASESPGHTRVLRAGKDGRHPSVNRLIANG